MNVLIVEPYFTGSHAAWAEGFQRYSQHRVEILELPGRYWKWRMHGGAVTLAERFLALETPPDLILATDMLDLTTFLALTRPTTGNIPLALYCHENQLTYPWSPTDRDVVKGRDRHYGFINFVSALAADAVWFNSAYHLSGFLAELDRYLRHFPDFRLLEQLETLTGRSSVLPLGLELRRFDDFRPATARDRSETGPRILWNHRWEYDKNPESFFRILERLARRNLAFDVAIVGENFQQKPEVFERGRAALGDRVALYGYQQDFAGYAGALWDSDILPVTSNQEFFGASVMEATYCGVLPLLPNRLTYPELFDDRLRPELFYRDDQELEQRLAEVIEQWPNRQLGEGLRDLAGRYDWSTIADEYDTALQRLADQCAE